VSEDFIDVIKSGMIGGEMKTTYVILVGIHVALMTRSIFLLFLFTRQITRCCNAENRNTKEKRNLEDLGLDGMIIFKGI
jgi:hypothetical protein